MKARTQKLSAAAALLAAPLLAAAVPGVSVRDLALLPGGSRAFAFAVDEDGRAVGVSEVQFPDAYGTYYYTHRAVRWSPEGAATDLGTLPGGTSSSANGTRGGRVVGWSNMEIGGVCCYGRPFVWTEAGGMRALPVPTDASQWGNGDARAVNTAGQVAGTAYYPLATGGYEFHATRWEADGSYRDLGTLGGSFAFASGINDAGQVVGYGYIAGGSYHAFRWTEAGGMQDLGTLPGGYSSYATAINATGHVVGYGSTYVNGRWDERAFLWTPEGGMQDLGAPPLPAGYSPYSVALGIDDQGRVSGFAYFAQADGSVRLRAFLWENGTWTDLGGPEGGSSYGRGMNNQGQIAGIKCSSSCTAALWTVSFAGSGPGATPTGSNVAVTPTDATTGAASPATITFDQVTGAGETTVISGTMGGSGSPVSPSAADFKLGNPPTYYDISTTATFTGSATICIDYSAASYGNESKLKLLHFENGAWVDITTSLDTSTKTICGTTTSFSPFLVAEQNLAPMVTSLSLPSAPIAVNNSASLSARFTDENRGDVHTASVNWEGTTSAGSVTEPSATEAGTVAGSHTYTAPGVYTIQVPVTDAGLSGSRSSVLDIPAYIVVYDPTAGFVTGGGWISSPEGACKLSTCTDQTVGKATFGFVSRYKPGATTPSGNTEFQFKAGGLHFKSSSYQWLVVSGKRAQYKGEGTVNGSGSYGFLITAIDDATDQFRIKIWDKASGDVVYDNRMGELEDSDAATPLGGGSIVIHK
jgi:probable HAF family extracellular repeat protein